MRTPLLLGLLALAACGAADKDNDQPLTRSMGGFKASGLKYTGRWAANGACSTRWIDFAQDQVQTWDGQACIFQHETPTAAGIDLEAACAGTGLSDAEQWKLVKQPEDQMLLMRGAEPPVLLARCDQI